MPDYLFLMHEAPDASDGARTGDWGPYIAKLNASGHFQGGSAIGSGVCARKTGAAAAITAHLSGYIRVAAADLDEARGLLAGNPVFEAGGTVEIRELPRTECPAPHGPGPSSSLRVAYVVDPRSALWHVAQRRKDVRSD